jgi:hypothetical protein
MKNNMSDEQFLELVKRVGARIAPHLRTNPLSREQCEELDRRIRAHRPTVCELTDAQMQVEIFELLKRPKAMEATEIVAALRKASHAPKDGDWSVVHAFLLEFERAGFVEANEKPTELNIPQYTITDKGIAQLQELIRKSGDPETSCGGALCPSPATE